MATKFTIRKATRADSEEVFEMVSSLPMKTQEGVNFVIDHKESISLVAEKDGQIVGFCGAHKSAEDTYTMVHYFVRPDMRERGIGKKLWKAVKDSIPKESNVFLWGYQAILGKYKNSGFKCEGISVQTLTGTPDRKTICKRRRHNSNPFDESFIDVVPYNEKMLDKVLAYDDTICPVSRHSYIERYLQMCSHIFVAKKEGKVVGYIATITLGFHFYEIAPLYADDQDTAARLMETLLSSIPDDARIYGCVVPDSAEGMELWTKLGLKGKDKPPLYTGGQLSTLRSYDMPKDKIYALCTAEFSII